MRPPTRSAARRAVSFTLSVGALFFFACASPATERSGQEPSATESRLGSADDDAPTNETPSPGPDETDSSDDGDTGDDSSDDGGASEAEGTGATGVDLEAYAPTGEATAERLVVLGADGQIVTISPDGSGEVELRESGGARPAQPTWSPDGRFVAWTEQDPDNSDGLVFVAAGDGSLKASFALPIVPFFLSWDPSMNGSIVVLGNGDGVTLALHHLAVFDDPAPSGDGDEILSGSPIFTSWDPAGRRFAAHLNTVEMEIVETDEADEADEALSSTEVDLGDLVVGELFATPVWLPTNQIALVAAEPSDGGASEPESLVVLVNQGAEAERTELARAENGAWMVAESGDESLLIQPPVRVRTEPDPEVQQVSHIEDQAAARQGEESELADLESKLQRIDLGTGELTSVLSEAALAFFANPVDRRTLALLTPQAPERISPEWVVVDEDGEILSTFALIPSERYVTNTLPFFDQYAQTASYWSSSGDRYVAPGRKPDGVDGIWVVTSDGEGTRVRDGVEASWQPRQAGAAGTVSP